MRLALLLLASAALFGCQEQPRAKQGATPAPTPAALTYDGASATGREARLAHGERMATVLGCKACHGEALQGKNVTAGEPQFGDMWAPNLSLLMAGYSDSELDQAIRHGVPKDKRSFWFMPSESFQYVSDADLAALIAWLRTVEPGGGTMPPIRKGPQLDKMVAAGEAAPAPQMAERFRKSRPVDLGPQHALGRYVAMTVCTECHNSELQGYPDFTPDLDVAGAYDAPELARLLTTGEGKAKKDLGLMSATAKHRFARLTPRERDAVVAYVRARAARPQ